MATASGEKITLQNGKLHVPDHPVVPYIEGDGTGRDIWRASQAVFDAAVEKAYRGKRQIAWLEVLAGEKAFKAVNNWLPDETVEAFRDLPGGHQGAVNHPRRRGLSFPQRGAAPAARPLRLPAPGSLLPGSSVPGPFAGKSRHGDLPREHRRHLRGHRVRSGSTAEAEKFLQLLRRSSPRSSRRSASPRRASALEGIGASRRSRWASGSRRSAATEYAPLATLPQAEERDPGPQGQHHEVHRRRLPQVGLRARGP